MIIKLLLMVYLLGYGSYSERKRATWTLLNSSVSYESVKAIYKSIDDPEIRHRLKYVAENKWKDETREKYIEPYGSEVMEKLQMEHFKEDFK